MADVAGTELGRLFVGPSGWSYPDWEGIVYPRPKPAGFDALACIADFFTAVEVNTSFYRPPPPQMTAAWVRRVEPFKRFRFAFKLHQSFTHQREAFDDKEAEAFRAGVEPVAKAGRLGCVLMQFPWSFRRSAESLDWVRRLRDSFGDFPLVAEVRHASWDDEQARAVLRELGIGLCNIDQPALPQCIGPSAHTTSRVAYVRLHGRRADKWFAQNVATHERYDYLYAQAELRDWVPRIRQVAGEADEVYVFTNNHYRGQGPANALELRALLEGAPVDAPPELISYFPALSGLVRPRPRDRMASPPTLFEL